MHVLLQSVVDSFDGKHDEASVYIRLYDNKLFLSDIQRSPDYCLTSVKVSYSVLVRHAVQTNL